MNGRLNSTSLLSRLRFPVGALMLTLGCFQTSTAQESNYSIFLSGNLTITSRLFFNIEAVDPVVRNQSLSIDNIFGVGLELRRAFPGTGLQIGISAEYLGKTQVSTTRQLGVPIPIEDGFWAVPVEFNGYFVVPFSGPTFQLYIGGGGGVYFGERRYSIAGERSAILDKKPGVGIHVITGVQFALTDWLAVRSDLKFRDINFETVHRFEKASVEYNGRVVSLDQTPTRSRMNVDGMMLDAGIVLRF